MADIRIEKVVATLERQGWTYLPSKLIEVPGGEGQGPQGVQLQRSPQEFIKAILDIIGKEGTEA